MLYFHIQDITSAYPEIFLAVSAMLLLLIGVCCDSQKVTPAITRLAIFALVITAVLLTKQPQGVSYAFSKLFVSDAFIRFSKYLIIGGGAAALVMALGATRLQAAINRFEFPVIVLLSITGMMVMVSANDFIPVYLGFELQSLSLYVLAAIARDNEKSSEAGLKYFVLGALASGIILYGISLIYGFTGTTSYDAIKALYNSGAGIKAIPLAVLVGLILIIIGLCFKLAAVPFHMWNPDVYEGAPTLVTSFFAMAPKVAVLALFIRVVLEPFGGWVSQWQQVVIFLSIASMVVGSLGAFRQSNIKRLMAYSSIGHAGYMLIGLASGTSQGIAGVLIYSTIYLTMSAGVFACILMMQKRNEMTEEISDLAGIAKTNPLVAFAITVLLLSMAGIPPLAGFFGKFYVFLAAIEARLYVLAVIGVLSSVLAAYYYLKVIKIMYFDEAVKPLDKEVKAEIRLVAGGATVFNLFFFLYPAPLVAAAAVAAGVLFG